jgi:hypothetical protein
MHLFANNMADPHISDCEFDGDDLLLMPIIIPSLTIDAVKFSNTISYIHSNAILNIKMYSFISLGLKITKN